MKDIEEKIEGWLQDVMSEQELFLVDIKRFGFKIIVFIDKDPSITIEQCAQISRYLESFLDGDSDVPKNYVLEVSSPGLTNPLKTPQQYKKRIGQTLVITQTDGIQYLGKVLECSENKVILEKMPINSNKKKSNIISSPVALKFSEIKKAIFHFNI